MDGFCYQNAGGFSGGLFGWEHTDLFLLNKSVLFSLVSSGLEQVI
jgi:hypothetical protein